MKASEKQLVIQWKKFLEVPSAGNRFSIALYDYISGLSGFIAHFNRSGFFKERFQTLADFDLTLELLKNTPLVSKVSADLIAGARYKIAATECAVKMQRIRILIAHCESLQREFIKTLY